MAGIGYLAMCRMYPTGHDAKPPVISLALMQQVVNGDMGIEATSTPTDIHE